MLPEPISELSAQRKIEPSGAATPLIIPSFSSRGFPDVDAIFSALRLDLYGVCLLSAFDLASSRVRADLMQAADLLVLDSGLYEVQPESGDELHGASASCQPWDRAQYRSWLKTVPRAAEVVVVSFDHYGRLEDQIEAAAEDFAICQGRASDFLIKPEVCGQLVRPTAIDPVLLSEFSVVGVTEKELGCSPLERCANIMRLRRSLLSRGKDTPIHIFGAVTPRAILAYFLCGADLFDGLNWLRYGYSSGGITPLAELPAEEADWEVPTAGYLMANWRRTLRALHRLQSALRSFSSSKDVGALIDVLPWGNQVIQGVVAAWRMLEDVH